MVGVWTHVAVSSWVRGDVTIHDHVLGCWLLRAGARGRGPETGPDTSHVRRGVARVQRGRGSCHVCAVTSGRVRVHGRGPCSAQQCSFQPRVLLHYATLRQCTVRLVETRLLSLDTMSKASEANI